jgi:hypothetical protein
MRSITKTFLLLFFALSWAAPLAAWEMSSLAAGGRVMGLGEAGAALDGYSYAGFVNPAGLNRIYRGAINSTYLRIGDEVNFKALGLVLPTDLGVLGFSYVQTATDGIYETILDSSGRPTIKSSFGYTRALAVLTLAHPVDQFLAGVSLKYDRQTLKSASSSGLNADAGLILPLNESQSLGLTVRNLVPGSFGQYKWSTGSSEKPPLTLVLGIKQEWEAIRLLIDINYRRGQPINGHAGLEFQPSTAFALRFGADQESGFGNVVATRLTVGLGLNLGAIMLDYAYMPDAFSQDMAAHYFSAEIVLP